MSRPAPLAKKSPADCVELPSCRQMLTAAITAYHQRMMGGQVTEIELGDERTRFAATSTTQLLAYINQLQSTCGDAETAKLIPKGNYSYGQGRFCEPKRKAGCYGG